MKTEEIRAIVESRLARWAEDLVRGHATPLLLIGMGHDHRAGQVMVVTLDDASDKEIALILRGAAGMVQTGKHRKR